jgi:hypothetical protein
MLLSLFRKRRAAKAAALLDEAKEALQRQASLVGEMHDAVAAYHAAVMKPAATQPPRSLGDLLDELEETADQSGTRSHVFDQLTLTHCGKVRSVLLQQKELVRDLPPELRPDDHYEAPASQRPAPRVDRPLIRRIQRVNENAESAISGLQWLAGQYREEAGLD